MNPMNQSLLSPMPVPVGQTSQATRAPFPPSVTAGPQPGSVPAPITKVTPPTPPSSPDLHTYVIDLGGHPHKVTAGELQALVDAGQTDLNVRPNTTPAGPWTTPAVLGFTRKAFSPPPPPPTVPPPVLPVPPLVITSVPSVSVAAKSPTPTSTPPPVPPSATKPARAFNARDFMASCLAQNNAGVKFTMPDGSEVSSSIQEGKDGITAAIVRQAFRNVDKFFERYGLSDVKSKQSIYQYIVLLAEVTEFQGGADVADFARTSFAIGNAVVEFQDALRSPDQPARSR